MSVGAGEAGRRGEGGVVGGGVEAVCVETQTSVPAHDGAVEPGPVSAGVDEAEAQRVGEVELWKFVSGGGGQAGRVGLKGAAETGVGRPFDAHEHMFARA